MLLILFHGAKTLEQSTLPSEFIEALKKETGHNLIRYAYLTSSLTPSFGSVMQNFSRETSLKRVEIFPIFLLPGKHIDEDIPNLVEEYTKKYQNLEINLHPSPHIIRDFLPKISDMAKQYLKKT